MFLFLHGVHRISGLNSDTYKKLVIAFSTVLNFYVVYGSNVLTNGDDYDALHYSILRGADDIDIIERRIQPHPPPVVSNLSVLVNAYRQSIGSSPPPTVEGVLHILRGCYRDIALHRVEALSEPPMEKTKCGVVVPEIEIRHDLRTWG